MQDVIDIEITPLSAACGAEIKGIDLTKPLSDEAVRAVKDAWAKHLVLVDDFMGVPSNAIKW